MADGHRRFSRVRRRWCRHASGRQHVAAVVDANRWSARRRVVPGDAGGLSANARRGCAGSVALERVGVEGTGSYGAGLARHLAVVGLVVIEVDRPNRQERHRNGKSDRPRRDRSRPCGARRVVRRRSPKTGDGNTEALRALLVAQRSAKQARISAMVQLRHLMFTAPDELRERYAWLSRKELTDECRPAAPSARW